MKRWVLGTLVAAGMLAGILALSGGPGESMRALNDARALADLPQRAVGPMLTGSPDLVVFQDGADGWFEVDPEALPLDLEIGFYPPRLIDMLGGGRHIPIYCGGSARPGKIIWAVQHADIVRDFAFCNPRRMDLGPLRPFATPVTMVDADLTQSEVEALRQRIAEDALLAAVTFPSEFRAFSHQRVIEAPFHWVRFGTGGSALPLREALSQAITTHLGAFANEADLNVNERVVSFLTDTLGHGDRAPTQAMGAGIEVDGSTVILPDVAISQFRVTVTCTPEACAALEGFDALPLLTEFRRAEILDRALSTALPIERNPDELMPGPEELRDPVTRLTQTVPVSYFVRYIERPQSE